MRGESSSWAMQTAKSLEIGFAGWLRWRTNRPIAARSHRHRESPSRPHSPVLGRIKGLVDALRLWIGMPAPSSITSSQPMLRTMAARFESSPCLGPRGRDAYCHLLGGRFAAWRTNSTKASARGMHPPRPAQILRAIDRHADAGCNNSQKSGAFGAEDRPGLTSRHTAPVGRNQCMGALHQIGRRSGASLIFARPSLSQDPLLVVHQETEIPWNSDRMLFIRCASHASAGLEFRLGNLHRVRAAS